MSDPPLHGLSRPGRLSQLAVLWALPVALLGAQLLGRMLAGVAVWLLGPGPGELVAVLAGVAGGGLCLVLLSLLLPTGAHVPLGRALRLRPARPQVLLAAAVGTFMLGPTGDFLMSLMAEFAPAQTQGNVPRLQALARTQPLWLLWPFFALLPGIAEELFFRGLIQNAFARPRVGLWVSGLTFSAFHLDPHHIAGVLPLGIFLAWVGMHHGTLVTIFAHVANNTVALLSARSAELDVGYGTGRAMPAHWLPLSLLVVLFAAWSLRRNAPNG